MLKPRLYLKRDLDRISVDGFVPSRIVTVLERNMDMRNPPVSLRAVKTVSGGLTDVLQAWDTTE